jgi:hypothetical protein
MGTPCGYSDFIVEIAKPDIALAYLRTAFGDFGCPDTSWQWTPAVVNNGSGPADSVTLRLRKSAGTLTVLDSLVTFSEVRPDSIAADGSFLLCGSSIADAAGFKATILCEVEHGEYKTLPRDMAEYDGGGGGALDPPEELRADLIDGGVALSWRPVEGAMGYRIEYSHSHPGPREIIATADTMATRFEIREINGEPLVSPSGNNAYDTPYYFSIRSCSSEFWCGTTVTVGPIYPWVTERQGWPQLLPETSVCAPTVVDLDPYFSGEGKVVIAATDRIYAWRPDGTPLDPSGQALFYEDQDFDPTERVADGRFNEALAFGNWDDSTEEPELAGILQGVGLCLVRIQKDLADECCVAEEVWQQDIFSRASPAVASMLIPASENVIFVAGTRGNYLHAYYGDDDNGYIGPYEDKHQFAEYFVDSSSNNYRSLAIGADGDYEGIVEHLVLATTRSGRLYCFRTIHLGTNQLAPYYWVEWLDPEEEPYWLSTPAVGDVDGSDGYEVVVTSTWRRRDSENCNGYVRGRIHVLDVTTGDLVDSASSCEWHFHPGDTDYPPTGPALADLDDDGDYEILVSGNTSRMTEEETYPVEVRLHVFDYDDESGRLTHMSAVDYLPYTQRNDTSGSGSDEDGAIYAIGTPIVGDFDYDGLGDKPDILVTTSAGAVFAFEFDPGVEPKLYPKSGWPLLLPDMAREPVLAELDSEEPGQVSLVVQCEDGWLHVYDLPKQSTNSGTLWWPSYGADGGNTRGLLADGGRAAPDGQPGHHGGEAIAIDRVEPVPSMGSQSVVVWSRQKERVDLSLYDVTGRRVHRVYSGMIEPGETALYWDGRMDTGGIVPSGVYWYRLSWRGGGVTRRVVIAH